MIKKLMMVSVITLACVVPTISIAHKALDITTACRDCGGDHGGDRDRGPRN
jgi:hypothetical protein